MGNRTSNTESRVIAVGKVSKNDRSKDNKIKTAKYTVWLFPFQNLFEQFRRVANIYFVFVSSMGLIIDSPVNPTAALSALIFVLLVTMIKQGYEDWLRHKADYGVNNENVTVIRKGRTETIKFHEIRPGELIKLERDCNVPCDSVLLWTSDSRGKCFVTTANLDGETSLKPLKVPVPLLDTSLELLETNEITLECLEPEPDIYTFNGKITVNDVNSQSTLGIDNLFLRGSRVKNTEWAIGCAVYTGKETKLSLNSKITRNKFTSSEAYINKFLIFYLVLLIAEVLVCFLLKRYFESLYPEHLYYISDFNSSWSFGSIAQDAFSFVLLYNYCIPISLYVSIEFNKFIGSKYFNWDCELICEETNQSALANTSDLNEELGQIEILFSDKTGTLTKNDMYFKACSINGNLYNEKDNKLYSMNECLDNEDVHIIEELDPDLDFFFTTLALCHTVQIEEETLATIGRSEQTITFEKTTEANSFPNYQAMSSDEIAFVRAAANRGIVFYGEESNEMHLKRNNGEIEVYQKLQVLEFTSARKRMSIIVKNMKGKIFLLCKGADCAVIPLCNDSTINRQSSGHLDFFSNQGLRTLVIGYKQLTEKEYTSMSEEIIRRNMNMDSKSSEIDKWQSLEDNLTFLGVTGVEDRLQDGVAETLVSLRKAGLQIWVLTGDKVETAINVAQSCGHIPPGSEKIFLTDMQSTDDLNYKLNQFRKNELIYNSHSTLILDGQRFSMLVGTEYEKDFVNIALACEAVICCRLSPRQKSQIVRIIKKSPRKPITAAIGDGANDISMIQEAHVGFGLFGSEGRQAARCADFAFKKFMMLKRILFVHGHWYYQRFGTLVQYSFYKNMAFVSLSLLYQVTALFSTQAIFDSMFLMTFNLIFSAVPVVVISLSEQCHSPEELMNEPRLYKKQVDHKVLSWWNFAGWSTLGIYHALIIFSFVYLMWLFNPVISSDGMVSGLWCYGTTMMHCLIILVNLKLVLGAKYNTAIFILTILGSIGAWMLFANLYSYFYTMIDGDVFGTFLRLEESLTFWILNVIIIVTCLLPDYCTLVYKRVLRKYFWNREMHEDSTKL